MVTVKQHVGRSRTGREVKLPQMKIYYHGEHVGYVGTHPNAPVCLIARFPEAERDTIVAEVARLMQSAPSRVSQPPAPVTVPADDLEDPLN